MSVLCRKSAKPGAGKARGFTLIELMIVVTVVAILVGIALPSYNEAVRKGRRGQAKSDLVELAQRAERVRTVSGSYATFAIEAPANQSPRTGTPFYDVTVENLGDTTFTLVAAPKAGTDQENDRCGELSIDQMGAKKSNDVVNPDCF